MVESQADQERQTVNRTSSLLFLILLSPLASADLAKQLEVCAAMEDAESRLACFDAIGRNGTVEAPEPEKARAPAAQATKPPKRDRMPEVVPDAPAPPAAVPDDFGMDSLTAREREELEYQRREEQRLAEAERKRSEKEQKRLEKERRKAEKAAAKAAKKAEREQVVVAKITSVTKHHDGRFSVTLDNGQVWRETSGSRVGLPAQGSRVELKRGRFGGYRMNIDGLYQTAWVKRTK
jgi:type IV secretory pathway VirB10-like protein